MVMSQRVREALAFFMAACPEARHARQELITLTGAAYRDGMDAARDVEAELNCRRSILARQVTVEALDRIIAELRKDGLIRATDEQLLAVAEKVYREMLAEAEARAEE